MSATNTTTNYNLPVFVGTDKPAWLTDWNGAMNTIDSAINNVSTAQQGDATAISTLNSSVQSLGDTVSGHTTAITSLNSQVSGNTGSINTINSLLGNGEPTTTDKTIIGAINELNAKAVDADHVGYDNAISGLSATTVQGAIDEVNEKLHDYSAFGSEVNVTSYTQSSPYTVPADGYMQVYADAASGAQAIGHIYDGTTFLSTICNGTSGASSLTCVFVKKGLKLYGNVSGGGTSTVKFYPLS